VWRTQSRLGREEHVVALGWEDDREPTPSEPALPPERGSADASRIRSLLLLVLAAAGLWAVVLMLRPFLPAIVTSAVAAVLAMPAYGILRRRVRHANVAALLATVVVFFLGLIPAVGMSLLLFEQVRSGIAWLGTDVRGLLAPTGPVSGWIQRLSVPLGIEPADLAEVVSGQAQAIVSLLAARTVNLFTGLGGWLLQAGVALFTLFYLLRDGDAVIEYVKWLLPLDTMSSDRLFRRARETTHATVFGSLVVAFVQAVLGGLAFWILGLPAPIVWAALMGILSILPAVGAWFVWVPAAIVLLASGEILRGVVLFAIGAVLISTIDNVLRTILVSDRAQLHPLVAFFSVLGGLFVFGAAGVFIGPVLFVMALTLIEIARLTLEPSTAVRQITPRS
jgi:predicted PurR-regulated permease PerM